MKWNVLLVPSPGSRRPSQPSVVQSTSLPTTQKERKRRTRAGPRLRAETEMINKSVSLRSPSRADTRQQECYRETSHLTMELHFAFTALCILSTVTATSPVNTLQQLTVRIEDEVSSQGCNRTLSQLEVSSLSPVM